MFGLFFMMSASVPVKGSRNAKTYDFFRQYGASNFVATVNGKLVVLVST